MTRKTCNKCKIEKELGEFYKSQRNQDGYAYTCKQCRKLDTKEYYTDNKEKLKEKSNQFRKNNPDKIKQGLKNYRIKNDEKVRNLKREWSKSENGKKSKKKYYENNSDKIKKRVSEYRKNNPEIGKKSEKWLNYMKLYRKEHYKKNPHMYLWRTLLRNTLKRIGTKKEGETNDILGYSALELKEHIENQFKEGMSWENWGEWHVDHKKPVSSFDKSEKISIINSLDNLQPLWAKENLIKHNKIIY
jgi:hypothetical protein